MGTWLSTPEQMDNVSNADRLHCASHNAFSALARVGKVFFGPSSESDIMGVVTRKLRVKNTFDKTAALIKPLHDTWAGKKSAGSWCIDPPFDLVKNLRELGRL